VTRWLVLPLGFVLVAAAGYALLRVAPLEERPLSVAARTPVGDHHGEIDEASRAKLRALLREAGDEESTASPQSTASPKSAASPKRGAP
jgi:hypothetical protein